MATLPGRCLNIDWADKAQVIRLAERLGKGQTVVYNAKIDSYSILHTEFEPRLLRGRPVVHRT